MFYRVVILIVLVCGAYLWSNPVALKEVQRQLHSARKLANDTGGQFEPWQLVFVTAGTIIILMNVYSFLFGPAQYDLWTRIKRAVFSFSRKLPFVEASIQKKLTKAMRHVERSSFMPKPNEPYNTTIPKKGWGKKRIMEELDKYDKVLQTGKWESGYVSGVVYGGTQELTDLSTEVYKRYAWSNPLHPDVFPQVRKMEAEVIAMGAKIFNGGKDACGTMTSGGTESLMLAMKAYRDIAFDRGIAFPEILTPVTSHCALDKAAHYFRMRMVRIPVDNRSLVCSIDSIKRAITSSTIVLVGSAPNFPHGVIDSIEDMARLAAKYGIYMHVDCCLGGFLAPFAEKAGYDIPPFDFRVKGVTSISADTHKYGFAPKGSSLVLYANRSLRHRQFFAFIDWPGGAYATATTAGSRSGAIVATTWSTMMNYGEEGYVESTRKIITTARKIESGLRDIPGLYIMGKPLLSVVAFSSKDFNVYMFSNEMKGRGWHLNELQFPAGMHFAVTLRHTQDGVVERFLLDARECVEIIKKDPQAATISDIGALYGATHSIPDRSIVAEIALGFLELFFKAECEPLYV